MHHNIKLSMKIISKLPELMQAKGIRDQKTPTQQTGLSPTTVVKLYRSEFRRIDEKTILTLYNFFDSKSLSDLIEIVGTES